MQSSKMLRVILSQSSTPCKGRSFAHLAPWQENQASVRREQTSWKGGSTELWCHLLHAWDLCMLLYTFCWFHASNILKVWISLNECCSQSLISMSMCWTILKACWAHARLIRWNLTVGRYSKQWYIYIYIWDTIWDHFHNSFQNSSHFRNAMKTEIVIR